MKLAILLVCALMQAAPSFEVASVKPSDPNAHGGNYGYDLSGIKVQNGTLKGIIELAYDVPDFQILGGPGWVETDRYDILTKLSAEDQAALPPQPLERYKLMRERLRPVLEERFQLKIHFEKREQQEYSLVVAKKGLKMQESAPSAPARGISFNCGVMKGSRARMAILVTVLSRQLGHPVIDNTNLSGFYDFDMTYAPDNGCGSPQPGAENATPEASLERPSLFTAIQEQLGLKLEPIKGPVDVIVIDRAEKPDAN